MKNQTRKADIMMTVGSVTNIIGTIEVDMLPLQKGDSANGITMRVDTPSISDGLRKMADAIDARSIGEQA